MTIPLELGSPVSQVSRSTDDTSEDEGGEEPLYTSGENIGGDNALSEETTPGLFPRGELNTENTTGGDFGQDEYPMDVLLATPADEEDGAQGAVSLTGSKDEKESSSRCCRRRRVSPCCRGAYRVGNCTVLFPVLYENCGFGIVGPHWIGLLCTFGLLLGASVYFTLRALSQSDGRWTSVPITFVAFIVLCTVNLARVACVDPGFVTSDGIGRSGRYTSVPRGDGSDGDWRWCDLCSVYQPPGAVHCPDCNLCVDKYDHHCPWMGTCIGGNNMKAFMAFNLSWLFYFLFTAGWVIMSRSVAGDAGGGR